MQNIHRSIAAAAGALMLAAVWIPTNVSADQPSYYEPHPALLLKVGLLRYVRPEVLVGTRSVPSCRGVMSNHSWNRRSWIYILL